MRVCQAVSLRHFRAPGPSLDCSGRRQRRRRCFERQPQCADRQSCAAALHGNGVLHHEQEQELVRVLTVTDLHVEYDENMAFCKAIDSDAHRRDVLIVSGDVSESLPALEEALAALAARFGAVFYTPGNHELWVRERDRASGVHDSLTKLRLIWELCARLGVHTRPRRLGGLWIVPVLSWHHRSFDTEPDIPGVPPVSAWTVGDYASCAWPPSVPGGDSQGGRELAEFFDALNDTPEWAALERWLASEGRAAADIISFSHFLPHQSLLPEKRFLYYPNLAKAVGSAPLAARLARLRADPRQPAPPDIHIFGHTHFAWDARGADGTRYVQAPLCSPLERHKRLFTVGFGASMEEARKDPEGAPWLPLCVYAGLLPAGTMDALRAQAAAGAGGGAAAGPAPAHAAAPPPGSSSSSSSSAAGGGDAAQQLRALQAQGWQPLRHGVQAPYQQAHWSDYYTTHARTPEKITLAPWVADRWVRRRARAAARRGGGSDSGSESSGTDPDTE